MKEKIKEVGIKIAQGLGIGGMVAGGIVIQILEIIFVWGSGLAVVYFGIATILSGSLLWGLAILFIGTPLVVSIASFLFPFWIIFLIIGLIAGLIRWIF